MLCRQWGHCSRRRWVQQARWMGSSAESYARVVHSQATDTTAQTTFRSLGVRPAITAALQAAFPSIQFPTESQSKFIPAVLSGSDVLLKDGTGTGKSLGLVIALLSKPRLRNMNLRRPCITSLVIVPHRDLAYQLQHWISMIIGAPTAFSPPPLQSVCQVLVRESTLRLASRICTLREDPPHVLIGTPNALLEALNTDRDVLQLESLSTVVVDEVDYLIESVPRKPSKKMMEKARQKIDRHPSATRQILDVIYASRVSASKGVVDQRLPQLVMSSATLRNHLKIYLYTESGWLRKDKLVKVVGSGTEERRSGVSHRVLVVPRNGETAVVREGESGNAEETATVFNSHEDEKPREKFPHNRASFNPATFEAIATEFALEVPSLALLVLPSSAPVQRAVYELRSLGVDAHALDLATERQLLLSGAEGEEEKPTLLVSTLATSRGLDLPELTHVFILGILEGHAVDGRTLDSYMHVAGRVGRVGRQGKVITVVEREEDRIRMEKVLDLLLHR